VNTVHSKIRILEAAQDLHRSEGAEGVSLRNVARLVGLSPSAVYRHYADKEALLDAVVRAGFELFESYLRRADNAGTGQRRVARLCTAYLAFALDHPHDYEAMFLIPATKTTRFPRRFGERTPRTFEILRDAVAAAMDERAFAEDDPNETALTVWSHAHGLVAMYRVGLLGDRKDFESIYRRSMERVMRGLKRRRS
jgi:AcrR family transcriptional regulator